jgi:hypothetical protein
MLFPGEAAWQRRSFLVAGARDASAPSDLDQTDAYRFGYAPTRGGRLWAGPARLHSSPGWNSGMFYFFRKCIVISFVLQTLKFHRNCFVNANEVIQISLGSLDEYLLDGIGLINLGAM